MKEHRYICPDCGEDITAFVKSCITQYNRERNAERMRTAKKAPRGATGRDNFAAWKAEHPEEVKANAKRASHARTAETFARQAETIRATILRKNIRFAELLADAKRNGETITPERESELLKLASDQIRAELKAERRKK